MFRDLLVREFAPFRSLSNEQINALERHYELMMRWNRTINLTRIRKLEDVVRFHYCESLFLASKLPVGPLRIVDIGSGAGFPGIPIGILRPDCSITLLEAHRRKAVFLSEAVQGLGNLTVESMRAEDCDQRYDWVVSRAVAPVDVVSYELASDYALLLGEEELASLPSDRTMYKVPWGINRLLTMFHVKHDII